MEEGPREDEEHTFHQTHTIHAFNKANADDIEYDRLQKWKKGVTRA